MIQDSGTGIEMQGAGTAVRKVSWTGLARNIGTMKCGITPRTRINSSAFARCADATSAAPFPPDRINEVASEVIRATAHAFAGTVSSSGNGRPFVSGRNAKATMPSRKTKLR